MDFKKAKPQIDDWWVVAIDSSMNRSVQRIEYITTDYVTFETNRLSIHKDSIDWIKKIDVWEDQRD